MLGIVWVLLPSGLWVGFVTYRALVITLLKYAYKVYIKECYWLMFYCLLVMRVDTIFAIGIVLNQVLSTIPVGVKIF